LIYFFNEKQLICIKPRQFQEFYLPNKPKGFITLFHPQKQDAKVYKIKPQM